MKTQKRICLSIAVVALVFPSSTASAGEPTVNPTGAWSINASGTNTQSRTSQQTLKLKLSGDTLTGTLTYNSSAVVNGKVQKSEAAITEAKLQGNEISFKFTHPPAYGKGPNASYTYRGKISGDTIKGTVTMTWIDHTSTKTWEAKRIKEM